MSLFFCLEGFSNDPGSIFVFPALQGDAVDLQNDLASFQLAAVMSRASFLSAGTREKNRKTIMLAGLRRSWTELLFVVLEVTVQSKATTA